MKQIFIDTAALLQAQLANTTCKPILVHNEDGTTERTTEIKIVGEAVVRFDMAPLHNLARVWVEGEDSSFEYVGQPTEWITKERV